MIEFSYDPEANAAYLKLQESTGFKWTINLRDWPGVPESLADINIDLDENDQIIGIEILNAQELKGR